MNVIWLKVILVNKMTSLFAANSASLIYLANLFVVQLFIFLQYYKKKQISTMSCQISSQNFTKNVSYPNEKVCIYNSNV